MNRQKENIGLLIGKVTIVCLFLILFAFKTTDCSGHDSFNKSGTIEQVMVVNKFPILHNPISSPAFNNTFEQVCKVNNTAIPVESISFPTFFGALVPFKFNACDKENFKIICSNNKVNQLLKKCKEQFIVIKPWIIDLDSFHTRTSLNNEEISLIS